MYNEVIVCEGTHDMIKIQAVYPDIMCIITNGSSISDETLRMIKGLSNNHNIVCFLDPDYPGERIRSKIVEVVPNCIHAYLKKELCISNNKKKVGIEHASLSDIKNTLDPILNHKISNNNYEFSINDLYELNIVGDKLLRKYISNKLNIGNPNNKTLIKRLNVLGITKNDLVSLIGGYYEKSR